MDEDTKFLKETLRLAKLGMGWVNPNPMVGAVIVKNGQIISTGYHQQAGFPHAEIEAIRHSETDHTSLRGTTLYVNLEPCIHFGKTPPCVNEIIRLGIKRVVCSTLDPNPEINGQGIAKLQKAGLEVAVGLLADQARALNEAFFTFHQKKRSFVAIKIASSLDGKIATSTGDSKWITNEKARAYVRLLRSQYQAVLVGINTILKDNPHLGARSRSKKDPLRIILDSTLKISLQSKALRDTNVLIATTSLADKNKKEILEEKGFTLLQFKGKKVPLAKLLQELRRKEIISILIEGGGETIGHFVDQNLFDKIYAFYAPIIIGGKGVSAVGGAGFKTIKKAVSLKQPSFKRFAHNYLVTGYNINSI